MGSVLMAPSPAMRLWTAAVRLESSTGAPRGAFAADEAESQNQSCGKDGAWQVEILEGVH